jgi:hypothetical protein
VRGIFIATIPTAASALQRTAMNSDNFANWPPIRSVTASSWRF